MLGGLFLIVSIINIVYCFIYKGECEKAAKEEIKKKNETLING